MRRIELILFLSLVICVVYLIFGRFFYPFDNIGNDIDSDMFLSWRLVINDALAHGEILHWNPYPCGGIPAFGNGQSRVLAPLTLLGGFLLDPFTQTKVELALHFLICSLGFYLLCKKLQCSLFFGLIGFTIAAGNAYIAHIIFYGHPTFYPVIFAPLLIVLIWPEHPGAKHECLSTNLTLVLGTALIAFSILGDGLQPIIFVYLILSIIALVEYFYGNLARTGTIILIWGFLATALTLFRTLPILEFLEAYPRKHETWAITLDAVVTSIFVTNHQDLSGPVPTGLWNLYVGVFSIPLSLMALRQKHHRHLILTLLGTAILGFFMMLGDFSPWSPWTLLRKMPILDHLRSPHRCVMLINWSCSILAVIGAKELYLFCAKHLQNNHNILKLTLGIGLTTLITADFSSAIHPVFEQFVHPRQEITKSISRATPFEYATTAGYNYSSTAKNIGELACWDAAQGSALHNYENFVSPGPLVKISAGQANIHISSAVNRWILNIDAQEKTAFSINHNYHKDWFVKEGLVLTPIQNAGGQIGVVVPPGKQRLIIEHASPTFHLGLVLSSLILILLLVGTHLYYRKSQRQNQSSSQTSSAHPAI